MKNSGQCPKCGSKDVLTDVTVEDRSRDGRKELTLATFGDPNALIFTDRRSTSVSAWVCGSCGFVEMYADNVGEIRLVEGTGIPGEITSVPTGPMNLEYQLHITRAHAAAEADRRPITLDEWYAYAAQDAEVQRNMEYGPESFLYVAHPVSPPPLWWDESGDIRTCSPDKATVGKLIAIAQKLGARVQGDEGEFYDDVSDIPD